MADARQSTFYLSDLDCADCAAKLELVVGTIPGILEVGVDFTSARLRVSHDPALATPDRIVQAVEEAGYGAILEDAAAQPGGRAQPPGAGFPFWRRSRRVVVTATSGGLLLAGLLVSLAGAPPEVATALYALTIVVGGLPIARAGLVALRARAIDMNLLMALAAVGAAAIGEWVEGAAVVLLFSLGNTLEAYTLDRARGAIRALMALAPAVARVRRGAVEVPTPVEQVAVGEIVLVRPGERIPVDGRVMSGLTTVDQAPITGESMPVEKAVGAEVFAGSINQLGAIEVEVTRPYRENVIAKVLHLVEEAQARRAPTQRLVDRFAGRYTPAVIAAAVAVALVPPALFGEPFPPWFYRALVLLVVSCPCALVISTPVSIVAGLARAAWNGILIKGGAHLETMGRLRVVAFDKTGTLTVGRPEVVEVVPLDGLGREELLARAATVEARSEHPLAAAVLRRARHEAMTLAEALEFESATGLGVRAQVDGQVLYVGSPRYFEQLGSSLDRALETVRRLQAEGKSVLLVGTEREVLGAIAVADGLRPQARAALAALRQAGIERVVMLTGDNWQTAESIARQVGVDEFRAELLPQAKVEAIGALRARYGAVAMVGDGVNDAPALASASLGIAMGVAGTDVALETADVALMADDLHKVPEAIALSRRTLRIVRQNIAFALLTKAVFLSLAMLGLATLWVAIAADMGASLLVTLNGMRLLRTSSRVAPHPQSRSATDDPRPAGSRSDGQPRLAPDASAGQHTSHCACCGTEDARS